MIRVIIAEDENITRHGIRLILESSSEFELIGEAKTGKEAVQMVTTHKPDVLLLDIVLPELLGFEVTRQVKDFEPKTKVLILSSHDTEIYITEAMQSGADGYILKGSEPSVLFEALKEVCAGRKFMGPPTPESSLGHKSKSSAASNDLFNTLTSRERLVLQLAAEGNSSADIGKRLHISPRTVETHRANLMRKLDIHSQTELVLYAIRKGIIST